MVEKITDVQLLYDISKQFTSELGVIYRPYLQKRVDEDAFICYKVDDHVAGICTYKISNKKKVIEIENLVVLPEYRGRGISTKLMSYIYHETESLIETLGYDFIAEAYEGLYNNQIYNHLSTHYTKRLTTKGTPIITYYLDKTHFI